MVTDPFMLATFSPDTFRGYIQRRVDLAGSQKQAAHDWHISCQYLNDVLHQRREPGPTLLKALGFYRHVEYWRLPTSSDAEEPQP
jgi:hypothetical protein